MTSPNPCRKKKSASRRLFIIHVRFDIRFGLPIFPPIFFSIVSRLKKIGEKIGRPKRLGKTTCRQQKIGNRFSARCWGGGGAVWCSEGCLGRVSESGECGGSLIGWWDLGVGVFAGFLELPNVPIAARFCLSSLQVTVSSGSYGSYSCPMVALAPQWCLSSLQVTDSSGSYGSSGSFGFPIFSIAAKWFLIVYLSLFPKHAKHNGVLTSLEKNCGKGVRLLSYR